jgi:hypothetical protein
MRTFKFKPMRVLKYPELCPVCGGTGNLKTLPVGTSLEEKNEMKAHIRIHLGCWQTVKSRNLIMSFILFLAVFSTVGISMWLGCSILVSCIISLLVGLILYYLYPKFIEISYFENEIELNFSNEEYASDFYEANCKQNLNI